MKIKEAYIFWTVYFDSHLSRKEGRRLPTKLCIPEPGLEELTRAVSEAGLRILVSKEARYPRIWWRVAGYVAVERSEGKRDSMKEISKRLRKNRSLKGDEKRGKPGRSST